MKLVASLYYLAKMFLCILVVCGPSFVLAQSNPSLIDFTVKQGNTHTFQIASTTNPEFQLLSSYPEWGNVRRNEDLNGDNVYDVDYTAPVGFVGTVEFIFSYTGMNVFPYFTYTRQVKIKAQVVASLIETKTDIVESKGLSDIIINPLENDVSSEGSLKLVDIAFSSFGIVTILDDATLSFTPESGFDGNAYIEYIAQDDMGTKAEGNIYIVKTNNGFSGSEESMIISTENGAYIFMPKSGMSLTSQQGNKGLVKVFGDLAYFYEPISGRLGSDVLVFSDAEGNDLKINIKVIDNSPDLDAVQDDQFYTAVDQPIVFDVAENDMIDPSEISYFSSDLERIADGIFSYTPPQGFRGFKEFIYKVNTGSEILTGNITVKIDNYFPQDLKYKFHTPKNKDLVIEYNVPIQAYAFSSVSNPKFGTLEFFSEGENLTTECGVLNNIVKVIYSPRKNFIGYDEFEIEYCTASDHCKIVKTKISVYEDQSADCPCINDCVYPGDANNDGLVNLNDMLTIGYYLGNNGYARAETGSEWKAHSADEWGIRQDSGNDLKFVDSDGNGIITGEDTLAIISNYGQYSTYTPSTINIQQKSPIKLMPQSSEYIIGDEFLIDVILGDDKFPALDVHGLVFSLNLDPDIFDLETIKFIADKGSWLAEGFGTITMTQNSQGGKVEFGISRISGLPKSGKGKVGTISVVGVEEIEGFWNDEIDHDGSIEIDIDIEDVSAIDSKGKWFTVPAENTSISILKESTSLIKPVILSFKDGIVYPNPANSVLYVVAEKEQTLNYIRMIDIVGKTIYEKSNIHSDLHQINVNGFVEGIYILEIRSGETFKTQKIKISR